MKGREGGKDRTGRSMRWAGLVGVALGLGLGAPRQALGQWSGGSGSTDIYEMNYKVGVGIQAPLWNLHVKAPTGQHAYIAIEPPSTSYQSALLFFKVPGQIPKWMIASRNGADSGIDDRLAIYEGDLSPERFTILPGGAVGIGVPSPNRPLEVAGGVHSGGPVGELSFSNRESGWVTSPTTGGERWLWYATGGVAKLWSGSDKMVVNPSGNVGIGTSSPSWNLHVKSKSAQHAYIGLEPPDLNKQAALLFFKGTAQKWSIASRNEVDTPIDRLAIYQNGSNEWFTIVPSGNVGIGITNPQSKLAVDGTIKAKDVTVTETPWSDHVFEEGYELMPLPEVGRYIEQHGRLPGVPSAAEVAEKGVSLGQTQAKLLEKVEELTLHAIELGRQNEKLRADNEELRRSLEQRTAGLEERLARLERP